MAIKQHIKFKDEINLEADKQERKYYPIAINLYEKGEIDGN